MSAISPSGVSVVPVRSKDEWRRFIHLPDRLSQHDPAYIPPLHEEQRQLLSSAKNPYFKQADAEFWLACRDGRDVGRISAQIDRRIGDGYGQFGMLAAEDDPEVFRALFDTVQDWHKTRGSTRIAGPYNLSINESLGVLIEGFTTPPMLMMGHDQPYVAQRVEEQGYGKEKDFLAYLYDTESALPESVRRMIDRPLPKDLVIRPLNWAKYHDEVRNVVELFNDAWSANWGYLPMNQEETDQLAKQLRLLLNDKLIWFAEYAGQPVGFIVTLPNVNEAARDLGGRLLPFGWAKLLWRLKVSGVRSARVALMGIRRSFANGLVGSLVPFLLIDAVRREAHQMGYRSIELSWILEDNEPMRRINEAIGGTAYKTYRTYVKSLV